MIKVHLLNTKSFPHRFPIIPPHPQLPLSNLLGRLGRQQLALRIQQLTELLVDDPLFLLLHLHRLVQAASAEQAVLRQVLLYQGVCFLLLGLPGCWLLHLRR